MGPDRVRLYRMMLTSRKLEEAISKLWHDGRISGEMHLGIGEEGIVAGVVDHLVEGDAIAADHRSTPPLVMRGVELAGIVAECLGSTAGLGRGQAGHMHLMSKDHLAAASGIVGSSGPLACGFALAHRHLRPERVAVAFFGEGAMNQGMLLEALNLAGAWKLPVLFVCKDNGMAITTESARVTSGNLLERAGAFGLPASEVDGTEVEAVWSAAGEAIARARRGEGASYIHASCVRPEGHFLGDPLLRMVRQPATELKDKLGPLVKSATRARGTSLGGRAASLGGIGKMLSSAATMRGRDPLRRLRKRLPIEASALGALEREVAEEVGAAVDKAVASLRERPR
jgi:TPP-dependent pyruvate/acetoin dehydrogenase alpha subunit